MGDLGFIPEHEITALRRAMFAHYFQPVAVKTGEKAPVTTAWTTLKGVPPLSPSALNTGVNTRGLRAVDIDIDDPEASEQARVLAIDILGATITRTRPNSARCLLVYRGVGQKRIIKTLVGKVEVLGVGQQVVAFGTHNSGVEFEWAGDRSPMNTDVRECPAIDEEKERQFARALVGVLGGELESVPDEPAALQSMPLRAPSTSSTAWASTALQAESEKVSRAGEGERNNELFKSAAALGEMVAGGHLAEAEVLGALEASAERCGLVKDDGWAAVKKTIRSGVAAGARHPRDKPEGAGPAVTVDDTAFDRMANGEAPPIPVKINGGALSRIEFGAGIDWTRPQGLLSEITDWILATSRRPNRPLAVAAAVSVVSTLCGRHLFSPTGCSLNLYMVCLAGTAVGKDRPLKAVGKLLKASGFGNARASGDLFSVTALENVVNDKPGCVLVTDEIGDSLFKQIMSKYGHAGETKMKPVLLKLFSQGTDDDEYDTIGRAQQSSVLIDNPSIGIFGASTPEAFFDSLTVENKKDGFMNRLLLAVGSTRTPDRDPPVEGSDIPETILEGLYGLPPRVGGGIGGQPINVFSRYETFPKRKLPWANEAVSEKKRLFGLDIDAAMAAEPNNQSLMGRIHEYSIRLASIHAVSRALAKVVVDPETGELVRSAAGAAVSLDDLEWGAAWALESARLMIDRSDSMMAPTPYGALKNKVKAEVREAGRITFRNLQRKIQQVKVKELSDAVNDLASAGLVAVTEEKNKRGPATKWVVWHDQGDD